MSDIQATQEGIWTEDMGEISGFGGGYETSCQALVMAAVRHLRERADQWELRGDALFPVLPGGFQDLDEAMESAAPGCSGVMVHTAKSHAVRIYLQGWASYVQQRRALKEAA